METKMGLGFFVIVSLLAGTYGLVWKSCDSSGKGAVTAVKVTDCDTTPVCSLKKGQNVSFSIDFNINEDTNNAHAVVHGIVSGIPVPFPLDNPDACKDSGLSCPLKKGSSYSYSTNLLIKKEYPAIKVVVKWELQDDSSNDIFCILVPVQIVDGGGSVMKLRFLKHL